MTCHIKILSVLLGMIGLLQAELVSYPITSFDEIDSRFNVKVNEKPVPVIQWTPSYAHFSFSGSVTAEIRGVDDSYTLSPAAQSIDYSIVGSTMNFSLAQSRKLVIHKDYSGAIVLFADSLEEGAPKSSDANVLDYSSFSGTVQEAVDYVSQYVVFNNAYSQSKCICIHCQEMELSERV